MTEIKYIVRAPQQSRLGGWFCQVLAGDELIYETFQLTQKWAFDEAVRWLHDKTDGKLVRMDEATQSAPPVDTPTEGPAEPPPEAPPESPQQ